MKCLEESWDQRLGLSFSLAEQFFGFILLLYRLLLRYCSLLQLSFHIDYWGKERGWKTHQKKAPLFFLHSTLLDFFLIKFRRSKHSNNSYLSVNFSSQVFEGSKRVFKIWKGDKHNPHFLTFVCRRQRTEFSLAHVCFSATSKIMMIMVMTMTTTASTLRGQSLRHSSTWANKRIQNTVWERVRNWNYFTFWTQHEKRVSMNLFARFFSRIFEVKRKCRGIIFIPYVCLRMLFPLAKMSPRRVVLTSLEVLNSAASSAMYHNTS